MTKKILISVLIVYIVVTTAYFLNKGFHFADKWFSKNQIVQTQTEVLEVEETPSDCASFAIGHIAGDKFRIFSRILNSADKYEIDENDLQKSIAIKTCDRAGQKALIYYDSKPIAIATVESYDYSKPFANESKDKPIIYTVLTLDKKLGDLPESGYVVAVFNYDEKNMDFYNTIDLDIKKSDEELISGSADTIYYQVIGKDPSKTEVEYSAIKTELNTDGARDLAVITTWTDPELPKGVNYVAAFNLHKNKGSDKTERYPLLPITKVRKSKFYLFQVLDIDNDGYKETIVRKEREGNDSFLIYNYNPKKDAYFEITKNADKED